MNIFTSKAQRRSPINWDFQTAIATLDKQVMEDIVWKQFHVHGVSPEIACCTYNGVPLYLIRCNNGISYVCTRAQALYFTKQLYYVEWTLKQDPAAFRVFPALVNIQHKDKGAQYGTHYVSLAKSAEYRDISAVLEL